MKHLLVIIFLIVILSCEKDKNEIAELIDSNPKIALIKIPGSDSNFKKIYFTIKINYEGELISSIIQGTEPESSDFIDSVRFFYTNNKLDSAIQIKSYPIDGSELLVYDTITSYFVKDNYDQIIQLREKSIIFYYDIIY
jgi:hypothetical protein